MTKVVFIKCWIHSSACESQIESSTKMLLGDSKVKTLDYLNDNNKYFGFYKNHRKNVKDWQ